MLQWANDQKVLDEKVNVLGGKFQDRLNDASNQGNSTAQAQTALNSYQANKEDATQATVDGLKAVLAAKPDSYEANRAVLKTYYGKLAAAHNELDKALPTAKTIVLQIRSYK